MAARPMDPHYEQRLRDEVIYLHSLWHQGPPTNAARPSTSSAAQKHHLQPNRAAEFKRPGGKKGKNRPKSRRDNPAPPSPGAEWPCQTPTLQLSTPGWSSSKETQPPKSRSLSAEEQAELAARNAHKNALNAANDFFRSNDSDDSDAIGSSSDEDDELIDEEGERKDYTFFFKLFKDDSELREYYEKNYVKGDFACLVCWGIGGKKKGKKYKGCLPLVQHSIKIAKTKNRRAHRALAQAICKVLGWDIDQLHVIVSMLADKSGEIQGNASTGTKESSISFVSNVNVVDGKEKVVPEIDSVSTEAFPNGDGGETNNLVWPDADRNLVDLGMVHPSNDEVPAAEGLNSDSFTCPDADKKLEGLGMVQQQGLEKPSAAELANLLQTASSFLMKLTTTVNSSIIPVADKNLDNVHILLPQNAEEPAAEGFTSSSFMNHGANHNLGDLGMVHAHNLASPVPQGLTSGPLNENNGVGNEMQSLQMGSALLDGMDETREIQQ